MSLFPKLTLNVLRTVPFDSLGQILTTTGHCLLKLTILVLVHLLSFHVMRAVYPALKKDKKRLSWILTWISTTVIPVLWLVAVLTLRRTLALPCTL